MLNFQKQRVLLANRALELLAPLAMRADIDQRGEPIARLAVVVLDDVGIDVDDGEFLPPRSSLNVATKSVDLDDRRAEFARRLLALDAAFENAPRLFHQCGGALPGQFLEFRIGVDDPFRTLHLRNDDGDRDLVEKAPERLAVERAGKIGRGEKRLDLLGFLSFFAHIPTAIAYAAPARPS